MLRRRTQPHKVPEPAAEAKARRLIAARRDGVLVDQSADRKASFGPGRWADPAKVRAIHHQGPHFKVKGPLNVVASPQKHPVVLQAGGSSRGTRAAAHVADHVFGLTKALPLMVKQREDLDAALWAEGREPEEVGIFWLSRTLRGSCR